MRFVRSFVSHRHKHSLFSSHFVYKPCKFINWEQKNNNLINCSIVQKMLENLGAVEQVNRILKKQIRYVCVLKRS